MCFMVFTKPKMHFHAVLADLLNININYDFLLKGAVRKKNCKNKNKKYTVLITDVFDIYRDFYESSLEYFKI